MLNRRRLRGRRRDLFRALGLELRRLREDAGRSQASISRVAGIAQSHLSGIEAGTAEPSLRVLLAIGEALGADLSVRLFPNAGPRIRDRLQVAMSEALIATLHPRWRVTPEVPVERPVRGVIDLVLRDRSGPDVVSTEIHSQLRRVEQQIRWAAQKTEALAALHEVDSRRMGRLLVLRNTVAMRDVVRSSSGLLAAAYPARTVDAMASLCGTATWPGAAMIWATIERGEARLLDWPPRGIGVGR
jgi:transcriptional regulator with XRE-family HTH domain